MPTKRSHQLEVALRERCLLRFSRRFEESRVRGHVLDIGPKFFLLALVSDCIWFDGFQCIRINDIGDVESDPYAAFTETALKKRGERIPRRPRVNVASVEELLLSASRAFPLVTIHREQVDPDVCWIGRVLGVEKGRVLLREIGPDARWDEAPNAYRLSEITRVDFGGDYEDALHLVGGHV
jgi:hypothetical protein